MTRIRTLETRRLRVLLDRLLYHLASAIVSAIGTYHMRPLGGATAGTQSRVHRTKSIRRDPASFPGPGQFFSGYRTHG